MRRCANPASLLRMMPLNFSELSSTYVLASIRTTLKSLFGFVFLSHRHQRPRSECFQKDDRPSSPERSESRLLDSDFFWERWSTRGPKQRFAC